jgi:pimeloyl-ACP methyl ester carboxylesterase
VLTSFAEGRLFGRRHGKEEPEVLALHGWGRDGSDFARTLDGLDAVALDLPGFGASPPPRQATGAAGYADAVMPVLAAASRRLVIVGHSFGGRVAVSLAASHPEAVEALVLTGVPLLRRAPVRRPSTGYRLLRTAHRIGIVSDSRMERARRRRGSTDYRAASGVMREVLVRVVNESYEQELAALTCPVELVWGRNDTDVSPAVAELAAELLRGRDVPVGLSLVEAGHHVPLEAPDALRAAIDRCRG